jgi:spermidine/putrescine transport system substrate-binding protein
MSESNEIDPRVLAELTSRRRFLGRGALALGGLAVGPALLAACSSSSTTSTSATTAGTAAGGAGSTIAVPKGGSITFLNWPLYIEDDDPTTSPTIKSFTEQTGTTVNYKSEIDGNDSFYEKYEPQLSKGQGIDADIIVLTSWMAARMIEKNFVQDFAPGLFPNKSNVVDRLANPDWDPGRAKSIPWAIGQTGIAYYPDKVGGKIDSIDALFDPKFKGKVTILDEMRDSIGLTMLSMGMNPETATVPEMLKAVEKIKTARDAGQFKKITGNSYTEDLNLGDTWIAMAWSGDIASLKKDQPGLEFVIPKEGGMNFVDNAMIPIGAPNKAGATAFLNHVYDPKVAAGLYESIVYVPPVKGAIENMTPEAKENILLNPPPVPKLHEFKILTPDEDEQLNRAFVEATQQ